MKRRFLERQEKRARKLLKRLDKRKRDRHDRILRAIRWNTYAQVLKYIAEVSDAKSQKTPGYHRIGRCLDWFGERHAYGTGPTQEEEGYFKARIVTQWPK